MRTKIVIALSILVLAILNYAVYEKEQIKKNGEIVLLKLMPVDPRSLMQGDYALLRYAIENTILSQGLAANETRGYVVVRADKDNVAQFVRIYKNGPLAPGEKLFRYYHQVNFVHIVPDSFFFQEDQAARYQNAKYGIFKFQGSKQYLLVGLADENRKEIQVPARTQ
jgi:uncharacterized membrane-anchored protein